MLPDWVDNVTKSEVATTKMQKIVYFKTYVCSLASVSWLHIV